jgi:carbon-monoxide dehydrogenase small subunit
VSPSTGADAVVEADEPVQYSLVVNGTEGQVTDGWIGESLLYVLRERLGLAGTKNACEQGECGSCSVLLDRVLVCACLVLGADAAGRSVETIEGYADQSDPSGGRTSAAAVALSTVQQAFVDAGAVQCGFCTPGLIVTVTDLLRRSSTPAALEICEALSGNLCRCTGYGRILEAVDVAIRRSAAEPSPA